MVTDSERQGFGLDKKMRYRSEIGPDLDPADRSRTAGPAPDRFLLIPDDFLVLLQKRNTIHESDQVQV